MGWKETRTENIVQLLTSEQLQSTFNLSKPQYELLMDKGAPHYNIEGSILFDAVDIIKWLKHRYYLPAQEENQ